MAISMQNKPGTASTGTQINDKLRGPRLVYSTHFPCCTCSYSLGLEQPPLSFSIFSLHLSHSFIFLFPLLLLHLATPSPFLFLWVGAYLKWSCVSKALRQNRWDTPWKHNLWVYNWCLKGVRRVGRGDISRIRERGDEEEGREMGLL